MAVVDLAVGRNVHKRFPADVRRGWGIRDYTNPPDPVAFLAGSVVLMRLLRDNVGKAIAVE